MLRTGIYNLLSQAASITALVPATNIFRVKLPSDYPVANLPAITFQIVSGSSDITLDQTEVKKRTLQIDLWSSDPVQLETIQLAVSQLLFCFVGPLPDGTQVIQITPSNVIDGWEIDMRVFRMVLEFAILHV